MPSRERPRRQWVTSHARRSAVELINVALNHDWFFRALGFVNRRTGLLKSVFLVYPATRDYRLAYAYPRRLASNRWVPWPTGVLWQNGRLTLMVAVSSTDEDFLAPDGAHRLRDLEQAVERIRCLTAAPQKSFAGILPGVMARHGILRDPPERELTARMVLQAVSHLQAEAEPVVVLGGSGFIGRRLVELLSDRFKTYSVDVGDDWPTHLRSNRTVVVNVANRGALADHEAQFWPGIVVLNEVYPEPRGELLERLTSRGVEVHHVVGVRAGAMPPFPAGYRGAIPCCAAWPADDAHVVVRRLNTVSPTTEAR